MSDEFDDMPSLPGAPVGRIAPATRRAKVSRAVGHIYRSAPQPLRGRILVCLLRPVGPLAMLAIAAGTFARHMRPQGGSDLQFDVDDVAEHTLGQIADLTEFVQQVSPETLDRLSTLLMDNPAGLAGFGAAAVLVLARRLISPTHR